jgi:hypothetical protein
LTSNLVSSQTTVSSVDQLKQILKSVTDAALFIEQLLSATGVSANAAQTTRLTEAFGNLAAIAIQAAHLASGQEITPDSVLALLPAGTPLVSPTQK